MGTLNRSADQDWYSFQLNAGDTIGLDGEVTSSSGMMFMVLWNSSGTPLATSTSAVTNFDQAIGDFVAPTTGTYYVQVTGNTSLQYSLVLT